MTFNWTWTRGNALSWKTHTSLSCRAHTFVACSLQPCSCWEHHSVHGSGRVMVHLRKGHLQSLSDSPSKAQGPLKAFGHAEGLATWEGLSAGFNVGSAGDSTASCGFGLVGFGDRSCELQRYEDKRWKWFCSIENLMNGRKARPQSQQVTKVALWQCCSLPSCSRLSEEGKTSSTTTDFSFCLCSLY